MIEADAARRFERTPPGYVTDCYTVLGTDTQLAVHRKGTHRLIAFEWSEGPRDWRRNLRLGKLVVPYGNYTSEIRVHRGWLEAYLSARDIIHAEVESAKSVSVTGFSLGGALATLCALDVQYNYLSEGVWLTTFGTPRVGNAAFRDSTNRRLPTARRYVYRRDLGCQVPPWWLGYRHSGIRMDVGQWRWLPVGRAEDHNMRLYQEALS